METIWIWIPLQLIIGIGFFYLLYREDHQGNLLSFLRSIMSTFLRMIASLFFAVFGVSFEQFAERNGAERSSKRG
ncbi:MAG: hypothetical protein AAGM67_06540 [Bacteroidota bacterium]